MKDLRALRRKFNQKQKSTEFNLNGFAASATLI